MSDEGLLTHDLYGSALTVIHFDAQLVDPAALHGRCMDTVLNIAIALLEIPFTDLRSIDRSQYPAIGFGIGMSDDDIDIRRRYRVTQCFDPDFIDRADRYVVDRNHKSAGDFFLIHPEAVL